MAPKKRNLWRISEIKQSDDILRRDVIVSKPVNLPVVEDEYPNKRMFKNVNDSHVTCELPSTLNVMYEPESLKKKCVNSFN